MEWGSEVYRWTVSPENRPLPNTFQKGTDKKIMEKIDAATLVNLFVTELTTAYPKVAEHLGDYILISTAEDGSSDYALKFVDHHSDILPDADKKKISDIFYKVKGHLI
jgi:hypothetical protein